MVVSIRPAVISDSPSLQLIELLAEQRFLEVDMREIAADEPVPIDELGRYASEGRSWVAVDDHGEAIGYILVRKVDQSAHIVQVSVVPEMQGRGIGKQLINHVEIWAGELGLASISLTTFGHVPWNRPLYEHLGFRVLDETEIGPELSVLRNHETAIGLDPKLRVAMRRELTRFQ